MEFGILGPLRVVGHADRELTIGSSKQRLLLAVLLCRRNQPTPVQSLVDAVWGTAPPARAVEGLRVYLHHLRRLVGAARVGRQPGGYVLTVEPGELDADRFRELVGAAAALAGAGDQDKAGEAFRAALRLWRGPALADCGGADVLSAEAATLEELRLDVREELAAIELALGRHAELVPELRELVATRPLRETLRAKLMLALYRSHRQAEALLLYEQTRKLLATELGLDPDVELRSLYERMLRDDDTLRAQAELPAQLPAPVSELVGRHSELAALDRLCRPSGTARPVVLVGPAGVGKTALVLHWAHANRHRYPDGQLFVDLRGFSQTPPADPDEALRNLLLAFGVLAERMPVDTDGRAALLRTRLSERRVLLVLDNAADSRQAQPLLPGSASVTTVITSRRRLDGLVAHNDAALITLAPLDSAASRNLLARSARLNPAAGGVDGIVEMCAGLPLALRLAAARLNADPATTPAALARQLDDEGNRLNALSVEDDTIGVRPALVNSYRNLPAGPAHLFCLLGLFPGAAPSLPVCATLAGLPSRTIGEHVDSLVAAHLATVDRHSRVAMHDLVRLYAQELAANLDQPTADAALRRAMHWYLHATDNAAQVTHPHPPIALDDIPAPAVEATTFAGTAAATRWIDRELVNLVALLELTCRRGWPDLTWRLVHAPSPLLNLRADRRRWISMAELARDAAARTGAAEPEAFILNALGIAHAMQQQYVKAEAYLRRAVAIRQRLDRRDRLVASLHNLASLYGDMGQPAEAVDRLRVVVSIGNHHPDAAGYVVPALNSLADNLLRLGRADEARRTAEQALAISGRLRDRTYAHLGLGRALAALGNDRQAERHYRRAVGSARECGECHAEATACLALGDLLSRLGRTLQARTCWDTALSHFTELGAPEADEVRARH